MASKLGSVVLRKFASQGPSAVAGGHGGANRWKLLTIFLATPGVVVCYLNAFYWNPEHEHRSEFIAYEHLRRRSKPFPWGDGNHTLFHNAHVNPLPDGFED